jgi:hypothetical protein
MHSVVDKAWSMQPLQYYISAAVEKNRQLCGLFSTLLQHVTKQAGLLVDAAKIIAPDILAVVFDDVEYFPIVVNLSFDPA